MANQDETGAGKDVPPWLQPVPEAEEATGFFASKRNTAIAAGAAVGLIIVFVVAVFLLYEDAPQDGPRHIAADTAPVREKPDEAGGMEVENQDKSVLEIGDGVPATSRVEIGDQPEQPFDEIPDTPAAEPIDRPMTISDLAAAVLEEEAEQQADRAADQAPQQPTSTPAAAPTATQAATPASQDPAPAGQYMVQLGAYGTEAAAQAAWRALRSRFQSDLGTLEPSYVPVESGDRTLYRLRVGMLESRAAADGVCISLRSQQQACFVVSP